jgi:hypothetical protein
LFSAAADGLGERGGPVLDRLGQWWDEVTSGGAGAAVRVAGEELGRALDGVLAGPQSARVARWWDDVRGALAWLPILREESGRVPAPERYRAVLDLMGGPVRIPDRALEELRLVTDEQLEEWFASPGLGQPSPLHELLDLLAPREHPARNQLSLLRLRFPGEAAQLRAGDAEATSVDVVVEYLEAAGYLPLSDRELAVLAGNLLRARDWDEFMALVSGMGRRQLEFLLGDAGLRAQIRAALVPDQAWIASRRADVAAGGKIGAGRPPADARSRAQFAERQLRDEEEFRDWLQEFMADRFETTLDQMDAGDVRSSAPAATFSLALADPDGQLPGLAGFPPGGALSIAQIRGIQALAAGRSARSRAYAIGTRHDLPDIEIIVAENLLTAVAEADEVVRRGVRGLDGPGLFQAIETVMLGPARGLAARLLDAASAEQLSGLLAVKPDLAAELQKFFGAPGLDPVDAELHAVVARRFGGWAQMGRGEVAREAQPAGWFGAGQADAALAGLEQAVLSKDGTAWWTMVRVLARAPGGDLSQLTPGLGAAEQELASWWASWMRQEVTDRLRDLDATEIATISGEGRLQLASVLLTGHPTPGDVEQAVWLLADTTRLALPWEVLRDIQRMAEHVTVAPLQDAEFRVVAGRLATGVQNALSEAPDAGLALPAVLDDRVAAALAGEPGAGTGGPRSCRCSRPLPRAWGSRAARCWTGWASGGMAGPGTAGWRRCCGLRVSSWLVSWPACCPDRSWPGSATGGMTCAGRWARWRGCRTRWALAGGRRRRSGTGRCWTWRAARCGCRAGPCCCCGWPPTRSWRTGSGHRSSTRRRRCMCCWTGSSRAGTPPGQASARSRTASAVALPACSTAT